MTSRSSPCTFSRFLTKKPSRRFSAKNESSSASSWHRRSSATSIALACVSENATTPSVTARAGFSRSTEPVKDSLDDDLGFFGVVPCGASPVDAGCHGIKLDPEIACLGGGLGKRNEPTFVEGVVRVRDQVFVLAAVMPLQRKLAQSCRALGQFEDRLELLELVFFPLVVSIDAHRLEEGGGRSCWSSPATINWDPR
jgi:hypothetical protein